MSRLRIERHADQESEEIAVQTWCRVCGDPFLLFVPTDYIWAVDCFYELDDEILDHGCHSEAGGWGVTLRLDEVLRTVYPGHHENDEWPKPVWYEHSMSEDMPITVVSYGDERWNRNVHM